MFLVRRDVYLILFFIDQSLVDVANDQHLDRCLNELKATNIFAPYFGCRLSVLSWYEIFVFAY